MRQKIWNQLSKAYYLHLFISNLCLMSTNSITIYHSIILKNLTGTAHKNSRNEKNWLHENTLYNFSVLCRIHTFLHVKNKTFYLNLHDFAIKIIYNTKLLICNVFWSIFRYVFQGMKSVALISSKLQKCGSTGCCKACWQIRIIKIINQNWNTIVLSSFHPVLGILCRGIKKRARNEKIYKTNSRLQFNSDSLNNNIWEFLQKGAKNWVQHFFSKKCFCTRLTWLSWP